MSNNLDMVPLYGAMAMATSSPLIKQACFTHVGIKFVLVFHGNGLELFLQDIGWKCKCSAGFSSVHRHSWPTCPWDSLCKHKKTQNLKNSLFLSKQVMKGELLEMMYYHLQLQTKMVKHLKWRFKIFYDRESAVIISPSVRNHWKKCDYLFQRFCSR